MPTKQLQDLNWVSFDHASHAPQLRSLQLKQQQNESSCVAQSFARIRLPVNALISGNNSVNKMLYVQCTSM